MEKKLDNMTTMYLYLLLKDFYKDVNGIEDYFRKMKKEEMLDWN